MIRVSLVLLRGDLPRHADYPVIRQQDTYLGTN
uniref:Uncharacterized protein n=1 Tax=Setaria viridis TaxID=4556 RepID=A0A4V6Y887_SETVI|nr:hypothetical protein SEVIR_6G236600v2 [Setaria viridis]